jgi:hypothetical protein
MLLFLRGLLAGEFMKTFVLGPSRLRCVAVVALCLATAFTIVACGKSGTGAAEASAGNDADAGPPIINADFGARMPRKCNAVNHVPNAAEAAALIQCALEKGGEPGAFDPLLYLWQNVQVQIGSSRPYAYNSDSYHSGIDPTSEVYPIRVTGDQLSCTGKPTCAAQHADQAEGVCYKTTFGDWHCYFSQAATPTSAQPAPQTY